MKRYHDEINITKRNWLKHRRMHIDSNLNNHKFPGYDPYEVDCECDNQKGRFRKKDAFDCGNPQCKICHSDKFPKREPTRKEIKSNLDFKEQKKEL